MCSVTAQIDKNIIGVMFQNMFGLLQVYFNTMYIALSKSRCWYILQPWHYAVSFWLCRKSWFWCGSLCMSTGKRHFQYWIEISSFLLSIGMNGNGYRNLYPFPNTNRSFIFGSGYRFLYTITTSGNNEALYLFWPGQTMYMVTLIAYIMAN